MKTIIRFSIVVSMLLSNIPADAQIFSKVKSPDSFIYLTIGDVDTLDPMYAYDTASHLITNHVYDTLLHFDKESTTAYKPGISEKVPSLKNGLISKDGLTYTFPIRQNAKFADGTKLTCEDAEYSIERLLLMDRSGGPSVLLLEPIAGIQSTRNKKGELVVEYKKISSQVRCEKQNLKITLVKPYGPFLSIMPMFTYIVPKKWSVANGEWDGTEATWKKHNNPKKEDSYLFNNMNGSGPYALEKWDKRTHQVILKRNDNYWGKPSKLERLVIKKIDEFSTRKLLIQKGDVDSIYASDQFQPQVASIPGVESFYVPELSIFAIFMNQDINAKGNPYVGSGKLDGDGIPANFFSDRDLRYAFSYAFNRAAYIKEVTRNKKKVARGPIPEGINGFNPDQPIRNYDLKKAEEYFKKAWGGKVWEKGFRMVAMYNAGNDVRQAAMNMLAKAVQSINPKFKIDVRPLEWSTYVTDQSNKRLTLYYLGWLADYPDAHNFTGTFMHSEGTYGSKIGYYNPESDRIVEEALYSSDPAKREKLYYRLNEIAYEDEPYIWVYMGSFLMVLRDWVKDYYSNPVFPEHLYMYPLRKSLEKASKAPTKNPKGT